ncbi:hypothetical protein [Bordetella genomosp. 9]|uniref:hypothetical protein n=1 Tax=Bordetella genomosp. 9 TaxID=1416803 RepID=UPI0012F84FDD|nr:hypothetical protein [Bordetella genomosp. 9]
MIEGARYVEAGSGVIDQERWDACLDLADQLVTYGRRKLAADPTLRPDRLVPRMRLALEKKNCGLAENELDWVMAHVAGALKTTVAGSCTVPPEMLARLFDNSPAPYPPPKTRIQVAEEQLQARLQKARADRARS